MLRKLLITTVISAVGCAAAAAQDAPAAPDKAEKTVRGFSFVAPFERSYLGVQTVEISKENFAKFNLAQARGVGVEKVLENSPAAKAGMQAGDVIVRFEGEEIKSAAKLTRLIGEVAPDQTAKVTVLRNGAEREFSVVIGKRELPMTGANLTFDNLPAMPELPPIPPTPQTPAAPRTPQFPAFPLGEGDGDVFIFRGAGSRQIGVGVTALTKQLGDYFGVADGRGLLINNVRENSPAAKAGLKAGDIIVEIEGGAVKNQADLIRGVNKQKEGDISLTIVRERNRQTVRVTPETAKDAGFNIEGFENFPAIEPGRMNLRMLKPLAPGAPLPLNQIKPAAPIM